MENVYDKILMSRPNTFLVFTQSGAKSVGYSPMEHLTSGIQYGYGHFLPGRPSGFAYGEGTVTFTGKFCSSPLDDGKGSVEFIRMSEKRYDTGTDLLMMIPNFLALTRINSATKAEMELLIYNTPAMRFEVSMAPSLEHIVVNVDGLRVSVVVNGEVHHTVIPEDVPFNGASTVVLMVSSSRLWGAVVRPTSVSDEYCREVSGLVNSFPEPAEAELPFNPTTFVYDSSLVSDSLVFRLEDLTYPEAPESDLMYNGSTMEDIDADYTEGWLNIPDTEAYSKLIIEKDLVAPAVVGSEFDPPPELEVDMEEEEGEALPLQRSIDGYEQFSIIADDADDVVSIHDLNQNTIGSPERVLVFHPDPVGNDEIGRSMTLRFLPSEISIDSTTVPDRRMIIDSGRFIGKPKLFRGGFCGESTILPDSEATTDDEYPKAYGMWVYLNGTSAETLATNGTFTITANANTSLTFTGVSQMRVNSNSYTSGVLNKGWNHIAFIPSFPSNAPISVTPDGGRAIVYSFSLFYQESPADYLGKIYGNFVSPAAIRPTTPDSLSISDTAPRVYAHDWSISSAD